MKKTKTYAVIAGDARQKHVAERLRLKGFGINCFGVEGENDNYSNLSDCIKNSDAVILPLPLSRDNQLIFSSNKALQISIDSFLEENLNGKRVYCGKLDSTVKPLFDEKGIDYADYFESESMTIKNAVATAEAALAIAIQNTAKTIFGSSILITGYGRIARVLAKAVQSLGGKVTIAVRSTEQRAWCEYDNCTALSYNELKKPNSFDLVFNTVPHIVFTAAELKALKNKAAIIDLASFPGGVDLHGAKSLNVPVILAPSLPGKTSPQSAGEFIADAVLDIEKEGL